MDNYFEVNYVGDYVEVISNGRKPLSFSRKLWAEIVRVCEANDCYRVLGIGDTTEPPTTLDGFDHAELFRELGVSGRYRVAWYEKNEAARPSYEFIDDVLYNRSLPGRLFDTLEEAKEWLLSDEH